MTEKMNSKVRKVRCARCMRILCEPPDVPVYECGGCGAKLQAKKRNNSTVETTSQRSDNDSLGKQKVNQVSDDQEAGSSLNKQSRLNSTDESDQNCDHNDLNISNKDQDLAKRAENGTFNEPPSVVEEYSSEESKMKPLSDDQHSLVITSSEPDQNSDHNDLNISNKDQDSVKRVEKGTFNEPPSFVEEYSSEESKVKELSDDQHSLVITSSEPDQAIYNDPRSSTEFSDNQDPKSSPDATSHNKIDQELEYSSSKQKTDHQDTGKMQENLMVVKLKHSSSKQKIERLSEDNETGFSFTPLLPLNSLNKLDDNNDCKAYHSSSELAYHNDTESSPEATVDDRVSRHENEFVSCRKENEIDENSSEFEETVANTRIINDSDGGSRSSFSSIIAEKLLHTRRKKAVYQDEDHLLSKHGSSNLHHRRRFDRISSVETMETARSGGVSYHGYEGSVSSFDGNDDQNHIGSRQDEHAVSGNRYRFNRLNEFRENPRHHHSLMIPENPEFERTELLKLVRELQDQLERRNMSNLQQAPSYYNHVGRYGQRMAFSGEAATVNRRHCCPQPQERHFSAQLPGHHACFNESNYGPKHNHSISESDFSAFDDHWKRNDATRPFRPVKKKRYVRPIAGGSPWITCYLCSELLQLPQSFLLFNKRYHSLRCGTCLKVLSFTLSNGTHVRRYYPEGTIAAPPRSKLGSFEKPVSCSDRSFEKSFSTETDRNGSREFSEERRKATMSRDPSGSSRPPLPKTSSRRKTTLEIEEVEPRSNGSALHWLMGYASPSKVIRGS